MFEFDSNLHHWGEITGQKQDTNERKLNLIHKNKLHEDFDIIENINVTKIEHEIKR